MLKQSILVTSYFFIGFVYSQSTSERIEEKEGEINRLQKEVEGVKNELEDLKLQFINETLEEIGTPISDIEFPIAKHQAMFLAYDEQHEQARWVTHMILKDIATGNTSRTNDFREDSLITTGTAVKDDYWYSGYDRGHLAPSADFRWSATALSESYFYSNMSPQLPELNREKWAELENIMRDYVLTYDNDLIIVTGPLLNDSLPAMKNEGRKNEVSIPELFYKVAIDITGDTVVGIGFVMPNKGSNYPVESFATTIDQIEELTGLDFFPNLDSELQEKLETNKDFSLFRTKDNAGNVAPINPTTLEKGKINTVQAQYNVGTKSCVCGTVVATKYSEKSGATFLNLDKKFPNQIFSVSIWSDDRKNFSYKPEEELLNKKVCITGKITSKDDVPGMNISNEKSIEVVEEYEND